MSTYTDSERLARILRGQQAFMDEVHMLLAEEQKQDEIIRAVVLSSRKERSSCIPDPDPAHVFHVSAIRSQCIRYRLRFLDAGLFKGELPLQAVAAIRSLERRTCTPITSFKIMAPAERFRLCDSEVDPLLFVPMGDDRYYLVHKWGRDLTWSRSLFGWPFRSPVQLAATVVLFALLLTLAIPGDQLQQWGVQRPLLLLWNVMVMGSFTVFGWFAFFGQFSTHAWNSRYFN